MEAGEWLGGPIPDEALPEGELKSKLVLMLRGLVPRELACQKREAEVAVREAAVALREHGIREWIRWMLWGWILLGLAALLVYGAGVERGVLPAPSRDPQARTTTPV